MQQLKQLRKTLDSFPWIVTLLLTIFLDGLFGGLYRMTAGTTKGVVIGILWLVCAYVPFAFGTLGAIVLGVLTVVDIICVIAFGKITVLA